MEVYTLDSLYRREHVTDRYESLIWTERLSKYGDFKLELNSTLANRNRFQEGTRLAINDSQRVMTVETVEDGINQRGQSILDIKGRSAERVLEERLALGSLTNTTDNPKWVLTGTPVEIAQKIFHDICVTGILDPADVIPNVIEGSISPADNVPPPDEIITYEIEPKTVYAALNELCDIYHLGFRMLRNGDTPDLYFDVYTGSDRTSQQTVFPPVIFSRGLDNLQNTTELVSSANYKNTAYVISPVGSEIVYELDFDPETNGFDRRVMLVKADDIKDADPAVASAKMIQRGKEELAKNRRLYAFDGEISQFSQYKYGVDYNLGDLVTQRNTSGSANIMQVTEQIFVSDSQGERSYPTLTVNTFVTPGSWLAQPHDKVWEDFGTTEYWGNQP